MGTLEIAVAAHSQPAGIALSARARVVFIAALLALVSAGQAPHAPAASPPPAATNAAAPARAVLYEEDPSDQQGHQYAGSVQWRTDRINAAGQGDEVAVHADIEIPDRKLKVEMSIRRNTDTSLAASHVIELTFVAPPDFAGGDVSAVPGILTKSNENARGIPLAGVGLKVSKGLFSISLSNVAAERARNLQYLRKQSWIDIPIVYSNQHRAILAIEKGASGQRSFNEAWAALKPPR